MRVIKILNAFLSSASSSNNLLYEDGSDVLYEDSTNVTYE